MLNALPFDIRDSKLLIHQGEMSKSDPLIKSEIDSLSAIVLTTADRTSSIPHVQPLVQMHENTIPDSEKPNGLSEQEPG
jgi:hypothetical protein